jgi:hypothetical protein
LRHEGAAHLVRHIISHQHHSFLIILPKLLRAILDTNLYGAPKIHVERLARILGSIQRRLIQVDARVVDEHMDGAMLLHGVGEVPDAGRAGKIQSRIEDVMGRVVRLQRQIAAGAGGGEELQGTEIGSLEDGVADGFSYAAVLRFGSW